MKSSAYHPFSKKALYFKGIKGRMYCTLCPFGCELLEGRISRCHNRTLINGQPSTLAFTNLCALHVDPVEKKPLYHFYPTHQTLSFAFAGCNLRCRNCQNSHISTHTPSEVPVAAFLSPEQLVSLAIGKQFKSISFTYTEPVTFYEYMYESSVIARKQGLHTIMVSSGYINEAPLRALIPYLSAANIDLKAFSEKTYNELCGASLAPVLKTLEILNKSDVWLEITCLLIPEINTGRIKLSEMCAWLAENGFKNTPIHFTRFFPTYQLSTLGATPVADLILAYDIARDHGLNYVYIGNYSDSQYNNTLCGVCGALLLQRDRYHVNVFTIKGACPECGNKIAGCF